MRVFCPSCGSQNEGVAGGRVTCQACSVSFDVPREPSAAQVHTQTPVAPLPATSFGGSAPVQPRAFPAPAPRPAAPGRYNTLAITSFVSSLLICVPFAGPGVAVITGLLAIKQINEGTGPQGGKVLALIGVILGVLELLFTALAVLGAMLN